MIWFTQINLLYSISGPPNGIMDMFIQFSEGSSPLGQSVYVENPTLLGQANPIDIVPLKEHSTLVYIYQDNTTYETAFHPVQADQQCHR